MHYEIRYKPAFAAIFLTLNPGDRITAEAGAMSSMSATLSVKTRLFGGVVSAFLKKFLGKESLFVNTFHNATYTPLELVLSQPQIGDIGVIELKGTAMCFQPGAHIAHTPGVHVGVQWAGFASWISGAGLFRLKLRGYGLVFFGAYGGLTDRYVSGDFIVDTGHLVAYEPSLRMNVRLASGLLSSVTSGEGFVNRLKGRGQIYLQSRSVAGLAQFLQSKLP